MIIEYLSPNSLSVNTQCMIALIFFWFQVSPGYGIRRRSIITLAYTGGCHETQTSLHSSSPSNKNIVEDNIKNCDEPTGLISQHTLDKRNISLSCPFKYLLSPNGATNLRFGQVRPRNTRSLFICQHLSRSCSRFVHQCLC